MDFENIYNELNLDNTEEVVSETKKTTYSKSKTTKKSKAICPVLDVISNSRVIIEKQIKPTAIPLTLGGG